MLDIVYIGNSVLRENSGAVPIEEIQTANVQEIIASLKNALEREKFGVAIAAPQIGVALRIFIVGGPVFASRKKEDYDSKKHPDQVFVNPKILKISKKTKIGDEGCLSVPGKYGTKVLRNDKVTISYYDEKGKKHERGASGFLARVFQHEIDHLNGILYVDEAIEVVDVDDELKPLK